MHPDDVAEYVVEQVGWVRERLADNPALRVSAVELEDDVMLYISFTKVERPRVSAVAPARLLGPGRTTHPITGIDLGAGHRARSCVCARRLPTISTGSHRRLS